MTEAERLANILETDEYPSDKALEKSAAELRRLHAINAELVEALENLLDDSQHREHDCGDETWCPVSKARKSLEKAKQ